MKKAQMEGWIIWLILAAAFLVIMFVFVFPAMGSSTKDLSETLKGKDFDGDNRENGYASDVMDPCPCGLVNVKSAEDSGKEYCVAKFQSDICACANNLANIAAQKQFEDKKTRTLFITKTDGTCLYTKDACTYLIVQNDDFMDQLINKEGPVGCSGTAPK